MQSNRNYAQKFLTAEEFEIWLKTREVKLNDVAQWLGVTKQTVLHYRKNGMNRTQALAISAIERGIPPWTPTEEDREKAKGR